MLEIQPIEYFSGAGGGKGASPSGVTEDPNNLRSRSFVSVLFLLSEGEISGLNSNDLLKDIYIDNTPVKNPDNTVNFKGVTAALKTGTAAQTHIPGNPSISSETTVGVKVTKSGGSISRSIVNPDLNTIRVTLGVQSLRKITDSGDVQGSSVQFKILLSTNNGVFVEKVNDSITGKTAGAYFRTYSIAVTTTGPWTVRVERITDDSTTDRESNDLYWQSFGEVIDSKLRYPNSALLFVRIDAAYFSSLPRAAIKLKGLLIRVPINYDQVNRTYSGNWNGLFKRVFSNNPAWIIYELMTNKRFGLGNFINENLVDKWSLYSISQYCDEQVLSESGSLEPRFIYDGIIAESSDAKSILNKILGLIKVTAYYDGQTMIFVQDKAGLPTNQIYTESNVVHEYDDNGRLVNPPFSYSTSSVGTRYNAALVKWNDPNDFYRSTITYVSDPTHIAKFGYNPIEVDGSGITRLSQAIRHGKWVILTSTLRTEVVSFSVGSEGLVRRPGSIIRIQDRSKNKSSSIASGRILSATSNSVTIDRPITLQSGTTYLLWLIIDGIEINKTIITTGTNITALTINPVFTTIPTTGTVFLITTTVEPKKYTITNVGAKTNGRIPIVALEYREELYSLSEQLGAFTIPTYNQALPIKPLPPSNLSFNPSTPIATLSWAASTSIGIIKYQIEAMVKGTNKWNLISSVPYLDIDISTLVSGKIYQFRVFAIDFRNKISDPIYSDEYMYPGVFSSEFTEEFL